MNDKENKYGITLEEFEEGKVSIKRLRNEIERKDTLKMIQLSNMKKKRKLNQDGKSILNIPDMDLVDSTAFDDLLTKAQLPERLVLAFGLIFRKENCDEYLKCYGEKFLALLQEEKRYLCYTVLLNTKFHSPSIFQKNKKQYQSVNPNKFKPPTPCKENSSRDRKGKRGNWTYPREALENLVIITKWSDKENMEDNKKIEKLALCFDSRSRDILKKIFPSTPPKKVNPLGDLAQELQSILKSEIFLKMLGIF